MSRVVRAVVGVGLAVVGAVTGNFALVVAGLQVAGSALMSPKGKAREASAVTVQVGEVSRQALFGRVAVAGSLADAFNFGGKYGTDWEVLVLPLADHRCDALEGFYVGDQYVAFTGDGAVPGFGGQLSVWWRSGAAGQSVPSILTQNGAGWSLADNGEGVAYVVVAYKADASDAKNPVWPGGRPRFLWVVRGALCYDPRRDASVGGSGPQRRENPATWTWSENPIVCRYAWVRGIYAGDRVGDPDQLLIGRGLSALEAPPANLFHRANLCDELVDGAPRYRIGAIVDAASAYIDVEQNFAAACAGTIVQPEGSVEIDPGEARGAVVTITDDDLLVGSKVTWNNRMLGIASAEWVNTVVASYVEPSLKWADHAAPVRRDVADILTDKRPREERVQLGFVTFGPQAGRIAEVRRRLGRLWGRAEITLPPRFSFLEEGDWIVWHSPRRFGPVAFTFRVEAWGSNAGWHHQLSLRQISASVYSDTAPLDDGSIAILPPAPPPIGAPVAGSWALTAGYQAGGDIQMPVLIVTGEIDDRDARFVRVEYALLAGTAWSDAGVTGPDVRHREIPVAGGGAYRVAISYVVDGVTGDRLVLGPVTAGGPLYADGTPVETLKPAAPGATPGAPIGTNIGGRPVLAVLAAIDKIEPIAATYPELVETVDAIEQAQVGTDASLAALDRATVDHAAALAQAERDAGRIGETLLRLLAESDRTRAILRDAGFVVDPASGIVRIYAIDQLAERTARAEISLDAATASITQKASVEYVQQQIALAVLDPVQAAQLEPIIARLTSAEQTISGLDAAVSTKAELIELTRVSGRVTTVQQDLNALAGTVSQKASRTDVDALGARIGVAEASLSALDGVSSYGVTVRQARAVADGAAEAGLRALLAGDEAHRWQIVQQAEVRSEMFAKVAGQADAEAVARQLLSVQIGAVDARGLQEATARIAEGKALSQRIDAQSVTSEQQAAAIATLAEASIGAGKGIAGLTTTIRQQAIGDDATAEGLLRALIAGEETGRARATQLAQVQSELTTTLIANEAASAVARQALLVRMASAEAAIVATSRALADLSQSLVERITAAEAVIRDPATGLAATRAQLSEVDRLRAVGDKANADATTALSVQVNDPATGLPATRGEIVRVEQASGDRDKANADATDALSAQVNHPATGLPATRAEQVIDRKTSADGIRANATAIDGLSATVNDPATGVAAAHAGVAAARRASADAAKALGESIETVAANLGKTDATAATLAKAVADGDSANATALGQVNARLDGVGGVGVEQSIAAVVNRLGVIEGRYTVAIDANGNLVGFQLIGSVSGPGSLNLINTDLRMGTGKIIFDNGSVMRAQGTGFRKNGDLITWFGPSMPLASCTRANAISYEATNGDAYFGGTLTAGTIKNAVQTTTPLANVLTTGPVGSNGGTRTIVLTFIYVRQGASNSAGAGSGGASAQIELRKNGARIGTLDAGGAYGTQQNPEASGPNDRFFYAEEVGGSITVTDNSGGKTVEYSAHVVARSLGPGPAGSGVAYDDISGSISIIQTEE